MEEAARAVKHAIASVSIPRTITDAPAVRDFALKLWDARVDYWTKPFFKLAWLLDPRHIQRHLCLTAEDVPAHLKVDAIGSEALRWFRDTVPRMAQGARDAVEHGCHYRGLNFVGNPADVVIEQWLAFCTACKAGSEYWKVGSMQWRAFCSACGPTPVWQVEMPNGDKAAFHNSVLSEFSPSYWWRRFGAQTGFKELSWIATRLLAIPASSSRCERVFSLAKRLVHGRDSMSFDHFNSLLETALCLRGRDSDALSKPWLPPALDVSDDTFTDDCVTSLSEQLRYDADGEPGGSADTDGCAGAASAVASGAD